MVGLIAAERFWSDHYLAAAKKTRAPKEVKQPTRPNFYTMEAFHDP
jgi:hypothetical protein